MNEKRTAYYPALVYMLLLLLVWALSWLVDMVQLFAGELFEVNSLVCGEGLRWALLNVAESLNALPWGTLLFLLFMAGLLAGSGMLDLVGNLLRGRVSRNALRALLFSAGALAVYVSILLFFSLSSLGALNGVTGDIANSPLSHGWLLVLFAGVLVVSLVYGFIYGNYRTMTDVMVSAANFMRLFMPAWLAMIPAAGLMPCLHYTGLDVVLGLGGGNAAVAEGVICVVPFVYVAVLCLIRRK